MRPTRVGTSRAPARCARHRFRPQPAASVRTRPRPRIVLRPVGAALVPRWNGSRAGSRWVSPIPRRRKDHSARHLSGDGGGKAWAASAWISSFQATSLAFSPSVTNGRRGERCHRCSLGPAPPCLTLHATSTRRYLKCSSYAPRELPKVRLRPDGVPPVACCYGREVSSLLSSLKYLATGHRSKPFDS